MATIEYNGSVVATVEGGNTATLPVKDLKMKSDIVITVPSGSGGGGGTVKDSALPIAVSTEAEMTALLTSGEIGGVYKYTGTTGTYENGALYVLENALITFTIDGTSYQAEAGMTWEEWISSEYNTDKLVNDNGRIRDSSGDTDMQVSDNTVPGSYISATELIISNGEYYWVTSSHGGGSND